MEIVEKIGFAERLEVKKKEKEEQKGRENLIREIKAIEMELADINHKINFTSDVDLIDSFIYEIQALQKKHEYLYKQIRNI